MATSRAFCYNPSPNPLITGTEQVGSIAAATGNVSINPSLEWWNGPDEDLGYVVTYTDPSGDRPNAPERLLSISYSCHIGFFRSSVKTDESFIELTRLISGSSSFTSATQSKEWLNNNGYWTSWVNTFIYDNVNLLSWPGSTAGFTKYTGTVTSIDDGFASTAIVLPVAFSMNNVSSANLYVSTNGYVTLGNGSGQIISTPQQQSNPAGIAGNPSDQWLQQGLVMTDGDIQDIYYQTNNLGGQKYNIKLIVFQGTYGSTTTPKSYILNIYRDSAYQWVETRVKLNTAGNAGPYNATDVSQPSSVQSRVWRGNLNGQNWVYLGTGSVI
jgi:hypothetical protein